jgi:signal transduction histidine kinase
MTSLGPQGQQSEPPGDRRDELLALVSHELRTPLTVVLSAGRVLERHPAIAGDLSLAAIVGDLLVAARRLERVVESMLLLARLQDGQMPAAEPVLVRQSVARAVEAHRREFAEGAVRVLVGDDAGMTVEAVPSWLQLILLNLLRNAYNYGDPSRPTLVQWASNGAMGRIQVCNSGGVIDPELYESWFQPFFRADHVAAHVPGAGLGLTLARRLTEMQGGTLTAERWQVEPGTLMSISLPLIPES